MVKKVISGGQTGADRGGLDAAIKLGIEHGGYCTYKRRADDGAIPRKYRMHELPYMNYSHRTYRNILESDGTVVFLYGPDTSSWDPKGPSGSLATQRMARRQHKPLCTVDLDALGVDGAASLITSWLDDCEALGRPIEILNVAGKRESRVPGIQKVVEKVMLKVLEVCGGKEEPIPEKPQEPECTCGEDDDPEGPGLPHKTWCPKAE